VSHVPGATPPQADPLRGIIFKTLATLAVAAVSALVKALGPRYPLGEIIFCRSFFMLIPVFISMRLDPRGFALMKTTRPLAHLRRSGSGIFGLAGTFLALQYLPLADANALSFSSPLFLIAIAMLTQGERVGPYRSAAAVIGFAGVILIALPHVGDAVAGSQAWLGLFFAIMAATAMAFVQLALRALRDEPAPTTVLYFALTITLLSALTLPFAFRWPQNGLDGIMLLMTGLVGGFAQLMLTQSYRHADATMLAPFDYLQLIWAVAIGYALFGEVPGVLVILGAAIITSAGLFIGMRERALARRGPALETKGGVRNKGIAPALLAKGGGGAMARQEGDVITQREELVADRADEGGMITEREIGAADGPGEEDIADNRKTRGSVVEDDMAGRVPGTVDDVKLCISDGDTVPVDEPTVGGEGPRIPKSV
jgi:drug/metabolite transporter (DMT)-like permease